MRVYELARDMGLESKEVLARAIELGLEVKTASSGLDDDGVGLIKLSYQEADAPAAAPAEDAAEAPAAAPEPAPAPEPAAEKPAPAAEAEDADPEEEPRRLREMLWDGVIGPVREVHVWTVNEKDAMKRLIDRGVDNLITDYPLRAIEVRKSRTEFDEFQAAIGRLFRE